MNSVTRDVIIDLWPVYEAGEASADSRRLVEQFLAGDRELESILRRASAATRRSLRPDVPVDRPGAPAELAAVAAVRSRLFRQRWLLAAAIGLTLMPFAFVFGGRIGPRMLIPSTTVDAMLLLLAAVAWGMFWHSTKST